MTDTALINAYDFGKMLILPPYSLPIICTAVFLFAWLWHRDGGKKSNVEQARYYKKIGFFAECCSIFSLIGVATFLGNSIASQAANELDNNFHLQYRILYSEAGKITRESCTFHAVGKNSIDFRLNFTELCAVAQDSLLLEGEKVGDGEAIIERIKRFSVIETDIESLNNLENLKNSIEGLLEIYRKIKNNQFTDRFIKLSTSNNYFIFFAFFCAVLSVSFKFAKSYYEWASSRMK